MHKSLAFTTLASFNFNLLFSLFPPKMSWWGMTSDDEPDPLTHNSISQLQRKWSSQREPFNDTRWLPQHPCDLQLSTQLSSNSTMLPSSLPNPTETSTSTSRDAQMSTLRGPSSSSPKAIPEDSELDLPLLRRTLRVYRPFVSRTSSPPLPTLLQYPNPMPSPSEEVRRPQLTRSSRLVLPPRQPSS